MREGRGKPTFWITTEKDQLSGHAEILLSAYSELDQDTPLSRNKAAKTDPWVREYGH